MSDKTLQSRYVSKLDPEDHLLTVEEWKEDVRTGMFIDYDGYGHPVRNDMVANDVIYPSQADSVPDDATHIVWFNR